MSGLDVILLRSSDVGAPVLSGTAGALIAVFDACLVSGYNVRTILSITRVGDKATVTYATGHGYAADGLTKVLISGADQAEYNGLKTIAKVSTLAYEFTVTGTPDPGTGTITSKVPPLGWAKPFSGTNKAAYRSQELSATGLYLRIDDTGAPQGEGAKSARARGYETLADIDSGTGLFPAVSQMSTGIVIGKSDALSTVPVDWILVGDGFEFHFFNRHVPNCPIKVYQQFHFGDFKSEMLSDAFGCLIYGSTGYATSWAYEGTEAHNIVYGPAAPQPGHYIARAYTQLGGAMPASKVGNHTLGGTAIGHGVLTYPSPHNNGLYVAPLFLVDTSVLRGQLVGLWQPLHLRPLTDGVALPRLNSPIGRALYPVRTACATSGDDGQTLVDLDGPWR